MKSLIVFICLVTLFSCKKDDEKDGLAELNGKWELRKVEYGYSVQPVIQYPATNGNIISFSGTNQYSRTDIVGGNATTVSGTYNIAHAITCGSLGVTTISFSNTTLNDGSILVISGDSLYFKSDSCVIADGTERTYVRAN